MSYHLRFALETLWEVVHLSDAVLCNDLFAVQQA